MFSYYSPFSDFIVSLVMRFAFAIGFLCTLLECPLALGGNRSFETLENEVIGYRNTHLQHGRVLMTYLVEQEQGSSGVEFEYDIAFSSTSIRFDKRSRTPESKGWSSPQRYIVTPERYIEDVDDQTVVCVGKLEGKQVRPYTLAVFHPKYIGLRASGISGLLNEFNLKSLGLRPRSATSVTSDSLNGHDVLKLECKYTDNASESFWIDPNRGLGIVQAEVLRTVGENAFKQTMRCQLTQYSRKHLWYPIECVHELSINGTVQRRETLVIQHADFEEVVDPQLFSLAGLHLKSGRVIQDQTAQYPVGLVWDGYRTRRMSIRDSRSAHINQDEEKTTISWFILANACVCGLLAMLFVRRALHRYFDSNGGATL